MAHRTAMGTKMAAAFANIFMARIENKSCIEPYRGQVVTRGFLLRAAGCLGCRPTDLWPKAEVTRGEAPKPREKTLFAWVTIKPLPNRTPRIKSLWAPRRDIELLFWKR